MKKKITLVMMALLAVMGVKADVIPSSYYSTVGEGTFFIYNVTEGKFLMTIGISENYRDLQTRPQAVTLTSNGDGTYKFSGDKDCFIKVGYHKSGQYLWQATAGNSDILSWTFNPEGTKTYKISANVTSQLTAGTYYITNVSNLGTKDDAANAGVYALITPDNYKAYLWDNDIIIPEEYYSAAPAETGEYYLYDMVNNKFLNTASRTLGDTPSTVTFTPSGDNYLISGSGSGYLKIGVSGTQYLWSDGNNTNTYWTIEPAAGDELDVFYIHTTNFTETNAAVKDKDMYLIGTNASSTSFGFSQWALITAAHYSDYLAANAAKANKATIAAAYGDATSFISNPTFDSSADGWTGGTRTNCNTWRGNNGYDYESTSDNVTFSQTLSNMPRGTYKLVAAVRGDNGTTATAQINETSGTTITNGAFDTSRQQINLNGVQMPYSNMGGFNTGTNALGWQWATATYTLAADGDLTISFLMTGAKWKGIDDVHLYYMNDGSTTYAVNYSDGINNSSHIVTCDLQTNNPNKVFTANSNIYTATSAATILNNLRISSGWINKLVLYDGYEVSIPASTRSVNSTLYRNIAAGSFATICCPFAITGGADGTFYKPESLSGEGVLNFETVASPEGGKGYLYKASSVVTALTHTGDHWLAENVSANGSGVNMVGTYSKIDAIGYDDYVLSGTNLYKVNSTVTLNPFRAYFTIPAAESKANVIALNFDGETTGVAEVQNEGVKSEKAYYDLSGRRVNTPKRGVYVVDGKKVLVK